MFPDLRLLTCATVATFFLAALAGLYASLRVSQDQIAMRADGRTATDDNPITRISTGWPLPEPGRAAALRELAMIAKNSPVVSEDMANTMANTTERSDANAEPETTQSVMPVATESQTHAALSDSPAPDTTGSTGVAVRPETGAVGQAESVDAEKRQERIGDIAALDTSVPAAAEDIRPAEKKTLRTPKKRSVKVQRRKAIVRAPEIPVDPTHSGYPLYLTVPVTN